MIEHESIQRGEVQEILRLANRLHATHDPADRKQRWLQGLCALFRASGGDCTVTHRRLRMEKAVVISSCEYRVPASVKCVAPDAQDVPEDEDRFLYSELQFRERASRAQLRLFRTRNTDHNFTPRDRALVELIHAEMSWLYQADLLLASADAQTLPPRARETLMHLLAGHSEKEIAVILKLSKNTVHHYAKLIHRHYDVSSRSELLARWVGK